MLIPLTVSNDGIAEWAILEYQGTLELEGADSWSNTEIGAFSIKGNKVWLTIANHQLEGAIEALKKPLLVMKKPTAPRGDEMDTTPQLSIESVAVVRKKIIFNTRPKPIGNAVTTAS
eukprot:TRINITY_DN1618_c0_g3_i1.p1 TRINITY_DN1618_c0_g3~~TRINITY_DN1618_c0_g3_i1.p1  ORF type:complete len:117 (-),score=27.32 TRINITY_DN1618_c0_g3_i1:65-415(-)